MISSGKIRVLCVDDHPMMRDGIAFALQSQADLELVGEATNGAEAVSAYRQWQPDVTLMDLQMPGMDGIDTIKTMRSEWPHAKVIVLTTYSGDIQASYAIKAGASGYLLKNTLRTELIGAIREVHRGKKTVHTEVASRIVENLSCDTLTNREVEILRNVSLGRTNKLIAEHLSICEDTVKGHMRNITSKLRANDRTHAVLIAVKRGYFATYM